MYHLRYASQAGMLLQKMNEAQRINTFEKSAQQMRVIARNLERAKSTEIAQSLKSMAAILQGIVDDYDDDLHEDIKTHTTDLDCRGEIIIFPIKPKVH